MVSAKTFKLPIELDGAPVLLYVRAFIIDHEVLGIRTAQIRDIENHMRLPTSDNGHADEKTLRAKYVAAVQAHKE
jgi:hypothetical protein